MNSLLELTGTASAAGAMFSAEKAAMGLLLAFVLGQMAAWVYIYTHAGLSYSRTFVQSIVLLTMIVALAMMVIGSNIVVAFGLIGALSVIRFRNILKDTRDTAFIFFSLVVGMASGTGSYPLAIFGTVIFCLVLLYLHWSYFGSRHTGDGFVRFQIEAKQVGRDALHSVLTRYCRSTHLVSQRFQESGMGEIAYRLTMRDPARAGQLVDELQHLAGVSHVSFVLHEEQAEV
jgi:uncharacterized membrane protein YhiD involved in acid resistance